MPIFWGDFLANTLHLSAQELGAYLLLIAHAWENSGTIRGITIARLGRIAKVAPQHWPRVWKTLEPFFELELKGSLYWVSHSRVLKELARADEISWKRKSAALQMHSKRNASAHANHDAKRMQNGGNYQASVNLTERSQSEVPVDNGDKPNANGQDQQTPGSLATALPEGALTRQAPTHPAAPRRDIQEALDNALAKQPADRTLEDIRLIQGWQR